jgi:DNA-binding NtrC family response regulator
VDDDDELRLAVDRQLCALGCDVVVVASGEAALRVAAEQLRIDVLLTELRLPDIDGRELAWAFGQKRPFVRVAFMGRDTPVEALDPSSAPFLKKPFSTSALSRALADAMPVRRALR